MAAQQSQEDHVELSETQLGLTQFFRDYFVQNRVHPTMRKLVLTLGKDQGQPFHDQKEHEKFRLFPNLSKVNVARIAILAVSGAVPRVYGIC
jgi:sulfur relay (sulfurtransferase) DsrC/TusE family protein